MTLDSATPEHECDACGAKYVSEDVAAVCFFRCLVERGVGGRTLAERRCGTDLGGEPRA